MQTTNVKIKFETFNDYNFLIDIASNDASILQGLTLLQEELPAEISFHVPESYHKRIIGVGGRSIQRRSEQRDPLGDARGEATSSDEEKLDGINVRLATLVRVANSNVATLSIAGLGTFRLTDEECSSGGTEILEGTIEAYGGIRCEPLEMKSPPAEKTCEVDCPEARRTCAHDAFRFRFGRMDPRNAPPLIQDLLLQTGCGAEAARVNIGALSTHPIWRPFYWVQLASCPFNDRCRLRWS